MIWFYALNLVILTTGIIGSLQNAKGNRNFFYVTIVFIFANITLSIYLMLYAEVLRFLFFFVLNYIAFVRWGKNTTNGVVKTERMNTKGRLIFSFSYLLGLALLFAMSFWIQDVFNSENTIYIIFIDAFLAVTETCASIFMIRKNVACIYLWTICNIVWIGMLSYLLIDTGNYGYIFLIALRIFFISTNWYGYKTWLSHMPPSKPYIAISNTYPNVSKYVDPSSKNKKTK